MLILNLSGTELGNVESINSIQKNESTETPPIPQVIYNVRCKVNTIEKPSTIRLHTSIHLACEFTWSFKNSSRVVWTHVVAKQLRNRLATHMKLEQVTRDL